MENFCSITNRLEGAGSSAGPDTMGATRVACLASRELSREELSLPGHVGAVSRASALTHPIDRYA